MDKIWIAVERLKRNQRGGAVRTDVNSLSMVYL